jgi:hypothetical protein
MKLTIQALKDPRAGFKQVRYMERHLSIGKNTGVRVFMDRLDILLTYLPLFPPMKGELPKELSDSKKATILYDALPNYYIKMLNYSHSRIPPCAPARTHGQIQAPRDPPNQGVCSRVYAVSRQKQITTTVR